MKVLAETFEKELGLEKQALLGGLARVGAKGIGGLVKGMMKHPILTAPLWSIVDFAFSAPSGYKASKMMLARKPLARMGVWP